MAKKNNRSENGNDAFENVDPLQPKLENLDPEFNFPVMLSEFENRAGDDDKKKAAILARVKVNEGHIRRISNLIDQLKFKPRRSKKDKISAQEEKELKELELLEKKDGKAGSLED